MADISSFIKSHLLSPLQQYHTTIQDTMIELIAQRLQELYDYTITFPEILSPNQSRLDILQSIADQFLFTIRSDAYYEEEVDVDGKRVRIERSNLQEQINILEHILYVYRKRGSIDTIENMWKYYGGELPKAVKVVIPSRNLFRYSISEFSGIDKFVKGDASYVVLDTSPEEDIPTGSLIREIGSDRYRATSGIARGSNRVFLTTVHGLTEGSEVEILVNQVRVYTGIVQELYESPREAINRSGVYEVVLTNNTYPIEDLKEFLIKELVAAGNYIYFTNTIHLDATSILSDTNSYRYEILKIDNANLMDILLEIHEELSIVYSMIEKILVTKELTAQNLLLFNYYLDSNEILVSDEKFEEGYHDGFDLTTEKISTEAKSNKRGNLYYYDSPNLSYCIEMLITHNLYYTPDNSQLEITRNLYNRSGELLESSYPGYFVLKETQLGKEVI